MEKQDIDFGDYVKIEMYRHFSENEHFVFKVVNQINSNSALMPPLKWNSELVRLDEIVPVLHVIQCGIDETEVIRVFKDKVTKINL